MSRNDKDGIPRDIEGQGAFWKQYYRPASDANDYVTAANELEKGNVLYKMKSQVFNKQKPNFLEKGHCRTECRTQQAL